MGVGAKALAWGHAVIVDDEQIGKALLLGVVVMAKRKRVTRMQPAVVGIAALVGFANVEHGAVPFGFDKIHTGLRGSSALVWQAFHVAMEKVSGF
jgi:RsiW-degrading membrane proteinase PrsW (M82 family)